MRTISVDYSSVGYAGTFTMPLLSDERDGLEVGSVVQITVDAVPPRRARVDELHDDGQVRFTFLDALDPPAVSPAVTTSGRRTATPGDP